MSPQPVPDPASGSPLPASGSPLENLQFDKAQFADPRPHCASCNSVIDSTYFHVGGQVTCPTCAELARAVQDRPDGPSVMRGALYGLGAAVACSICYAIVSIVTGFELALIAILVGYLVGSAVRKGSGGLGGRRCQVLAVVLTYLAITMSYVPLIIKQFSDKQATTQSAGAGTSKPPAKDGSGVAVEPEVKLTPATAVFAVVLLAGVSLLAPFLGLANGFNGIMGILIIFFGLSRAWKLTARDPRLIVGPYTVEGPATGA